MFNINDMALGLAGIGAPSNETQRNVNDALLRYFVMKGAYDATGAVTSHLIGKPDLESENLKLDLALKRHQLGLPNDSEEFNESINTPGNSILAALGINFEKRLSSPQVLPKTVRAERWGLFPWGDVEEGMTDVLTSGLGRAGSGVGASAGRRALRRAIGL